MLLKKLTHCRKSEGLGCVPLSFQEAMACTWTAASQHLELLVELLPALETPTLYRRQADDFLQVVVLFVLRLEEPCRNQTYLFVC